MVAPSHSSGGPPAPASRRGAPPGAWTALALALCIAGCGRHGATAPPAPSATSRSWRMGFSDLPPRPDITVLLAALNLWSARADAAIFHEDPPWGALLDGRPADSLARANYLQVVQLYRGKGLPIAFEVELTNGLDRSTISDSLKARGLSLSSPAVRAAALTWAAAVDTLLAPDWLGLGSEVNLVHLAAPDSIYQAERRLAAAIADSLAALHQRYRGPHAGALYVTMQVDAAWGRLDRTGVWRGVAGEVADFPFAQSIGLSAYPYLAGFGEPDSVPADYFSRVAQEAGKPVFVSEGGWSSIGLASQGVTSSPEKQARYVRRMATLLGNAHAFAWFHLEFADLDLSAWPQQPPNSILPLFATIGFVDPTLAPKPALAAWDSIYARTRVN